MMTEMKMLLWKDLRLSRICIVTGIIFIICPYLLFFFPYIEWTYYCAWVVSTEVSQLTIALLAGNIIACERVDRSATFLAYQGARRKMVIASKLIICTITFVSICAISIILSFWLKGIRPEDVNEFRIGQTCIVTTGFCFFGCCWLLSALLSSSVNSIVLGLLPPIFIGITLSITSHFLHWPRIMEVPYWYIVFVTAAGLISLMAGTWHFIRSKES
jgi:ABC-type transport system involved in multi-copper enzyme maturation permease subunit